MLLRIVLTAAVGLGALVFGSSSAQAQYWGGPSGFGHSLHTGSSHGFGSFRIVTPSRQSWHSGGHGDHDRDHGRGHHDRDHGHGHGHGHGSSHHPAPRVWHDTTHWDYHAPTIQRHGLHFHVTPGHYDLHRSGHWDYLHH